MGTVALKRLPKTAQRSITGAVVGLVHDVDASGVVFVACPQSGVGPTAARLAGAFDTAELIAGARVLLLFEDSSPALPLIVGLVSDRVQRRQRATPRDAVVDGQRVVLEGQKEVVLRCGRGSITLTADGKIVLKGTELISRSSGANKIRGAMVNIN
jgi:hypothetical protein